MSRSLRKTLKKAQSSIDSRTVSKGHSEDRSAIVKPTKDNTRDKLVDGIKVARTLNDFLTLEPDKSAVALDVFSNAR